MNYIVFITINKLTNEYYIGITNNEDTNYLGEGIWRYLASTYMYPKTLLQLAVKQYGQLNFIRCDLAKYDDLGKAITKYTTMSSWQPNMYTAKHNLGICKYYPIYQFDLNGKLIKKWEMAIDACSFYNTSIEKLMFAVDNMHPLAKSLWSCIATVNTDVYSTKPWNNALTTYVYDRDGNLNSTYITPQEVSKELNIDINVVKDAIKNLHLVDNKYYITNKLILHYKPKARRQYAKCSIYIYDKDCQFVKTIKGKELLRFLKQHSWQKISKACELTDGWYDNYYLSFKKEPPMKRYFKVYNLNGDLLETTDDKEILITKYGLTKAEVERVIRGKKHQNNYVIYYCK